MAGGGFNHKVWESYTHGGLHSLQYVLINLQCLFCGSCIFVVRFRSIFYEMLIFHVSIYRLCLSHLLIFLL